MVTSILKWRRRKWKCTNPGQDKPLEDTNKAGENFPLSYIQETGAMSMLGMYLAPGGKNKDQVKYMHQKVTV